jgi:hypothetical protein
MSAWAWILVGVGALFTLSLLVGLALGATLRRMSTDLSGLIEHEQWIFSPLTRDDEAAEEVAAAEPSEAAEKVLAGR